MLRAVALLLSLLLADLVTAQDATAPSVQDRLLAAARQNAHAIEFDGSSFAGPGWSLVQRETRDCEFVLLGEEHGLAEIPVFARELFLGLRPHGFDTLAVEISAPIAEELDRAARDGLSGIEAFVRSWPPGPAFYFWKSEAELIAAVRAAVPGPQDVVWGLDYEVTCDRRLIDRLRHRAPAAARAALDTLLQASAAAAAKWRETRSPAELFLFSGDPELVRAVRAAWPAPDAEASRLLRTLEESLEINRLFPDRPWESNERRSRFNRANLIEQLAAAERRAARPKVLFKMGETHLMRGVTSTGNFDVGSLVAEIAALRGGKSFSIIAGGGKGGRHGILKPTDMSVVDAPVSMFEGLMKLGFLTEAFAGTSPVLIDLRPLRAIVSTPTRLASLHNAEAVRAIHAFDVMVIWNGSTAARMLVKP